MIKVKDLKKSYGEVQALRGVSFEVQEGEIVGLLGPNGAGKSTTIKILTGYLHPDEGTVEIDNLNVLTHVREVEARIGYLPENTPLYQDLSVQSYLRFMADMRGIPKDEQAELISEAIIATDMMNHRARPINQLSKGLRQRVGIAQAILHRPKLLILDEPTIGLDPTQIVEIRHLIKRLSQHSTILFSSHILSEVQAVCDRVVIIINGEVRADARLDELGATSDMILVLEKAAKGAEDQLAKIPTVEAIETFTTNEGYPAYRVTSHGDLGRQIYDLARKSDWPLRELRREVLTLEAVFNQLATAEPIAEDDEDEEMEEEEALPY